MTSDDMELVREYALTNSERAFAALVSRHINLVHSVAMRQVGDSHWAEDITQTVFLLLAKKAKSLSKDTVLSGWLCRTARFISADAIKAQRRRQFRETEVQMESALSESNPGSWRQIAPLLEEALEALPEKEHDAVVLRFFEGKKLRELGLAMGTGEDAARMCVNRGLEKLRKYFLKRGVALSAVTIATAISGNAVQVAPAGMAGAITVAATSGAVLSAATLAATKSIAMTTLHKACMISLATMLTGTGIYEADDAAIQFDRVPVHVRTFVRRTGIGTRRGRKGGASHSRGGRGRKREVVRFTARVALPGWNRPGSGNKSRTFRVNPWCLRRLGPGLLGIPGLYRQSSGAGGREQRTHFGAIERNSQRGAI
jgi:RNA polymerase sigma factor (sigma-70 family)